MVIDLPEIPKVPDLFGATIKALDGLGGSASNDEIDDRVGDLLALSAEVRSFIHKAGPLPKVNYRCAWARSWLKNAGFVENSGRGVWSLTALGRSALIQYNEAELVKRVRQANYALRKGMSLTEDAPPPTEGELTVSLQPEMGWREQLLETLGQIHPAAFERLCQRLLREAGFTRVEVTGKTGDGGIDGTGVLRMNLLSFQVIFQCKRWKGSVGAATVRDFRGAMVGRADKGLILTTAAFTADARREATRDGAPAIDLVDGEALCDLLKLHRIGLTVKMVEEITLDHQALSAI
ncbi:restriction endonuclease [Methylobacterium sp. WL116]|uniref:restriction endonuclease n=1 Tax=Methylobacterium sp. WL116 TaxID=2603889 RepID=UPI0011C98A90|nr:restriction endonuclease [Methylobacterium sp. WL116]TXM95383.1 restriction endonuclease [Methylobacterium sp. WL116]